MGDDGDDTLHPFPSSFFYSPLSFFKDKERSRRILSSPIVTNRHIVTFDRGDFFQKPEKSAETWSHGLSPTSSMSSSGSGTRTLLSGRSHGKIEDGVGLLVVLMKGRAWSLVSRIREPSICPKLGHWCGFGIR
jgi:hypothetical protein